MLLYTRFFSWPSNSDGSRGNFAPCRRRGLGDELIPELPVDVIMLLVNSVQPQRPGNDFYYTRSEWREVFLAKLEI
jgi:hypothetical protein